MSRRLAVVSSVLALGVALVGCGGDKGSGSAASSASCGRPTGGSFTLVAKNVKFNVDCITLAQPGRLQITMRSEDQAAHNIHVSGHGVDSKTTLEAGPVTQHLTVDLPAAGDYTFICDLHEFAMKGTIHVG